MTDINTELYDKMFGEQKMFSEYLISLGVEEALKHAYEYTIRQDILYSLQEKQLPDALAEALLRSLAPLSDIYKDWEKYQSNYMSELRAVIENRAKAMMD